MATLRDGGAAAYGNELGPQGGRLLNLPVLTTTALAVDDSPATNVVALLSPSEIFFTDESEVILSTSNAAALQMDDSPAASASDLVSLWQCNSTAAKAVHASGWHAKAGAAAYFTTPY